MKIPPKINLARIPTPIERLKFEGSSFLIKRDDLTGTELSGNKIRKLEYLLCRAEKEKTDVIFTCGGLQSNHARAAVTAAASRGMKTKLFLWGKDTSNAEGNLFICKLLGAEIIYLNREEYQNVNEIMSREKVKLEKQGHKVFVIPEGGSTTTGIFGYIKCYEEMLNDLKDVPALTLAAGTGGTAAGLLAGAALFSKNTVIYAVNVLYPAPVIRKKILLLAEACILEYNLNCRIDEKNLVILDGYSGEGYKNISEDKIRLIKRFARSAGIILDPAYTGKAFAAYYELFLKHNKGMKNIFLHTGGLFGVFSKRNAYLK